MSVVGERILAYALGTQMLDIHVGDGDLGSRGETLPGGKELTGLVDQGLPIPSKVGR